MKMEFIELDHGIFIDLIPETMDEVSQLARYATNANSEKPKVYMSFYKEPHLSIGLFKRKKSVHKTSIRP